MILSNHNNKNYKYSGFVLKSVEKPHIGDFLKSRRRKVPSRKLNFKTISNFSTNIVNK